MVKELGEFVKGIVDVAKDYSIPGKLLTSTANYVQRVADRWAKEDPQPDISNDGGSIVKQLGRISKEEGGRFGKELLISLLPIGPTINND